jgi:hypothetical protein
MRHWIALWMIRKPVEGSTFGNFFERTARDVKIIILEGALRQFEAKEAWWRENRERQDLFAEEFEQTLRHIAEFPTHGQRYRVARGKMILRVQMKKTCDHVYYWYDAPSEQVEIHAIWGGARGRGPNL